MGVDKFYRQGIGPGREGKVFGTPAPASPPARTAHDELNERAAQIRAQKPGMSAEQAFNEALASSPDLAGRYRKEQEGR